MKIMENARVKETELRNTLRRRLFLWFDESSLILVPEMLARYPGMTGRTQGEKKERIPPAKATENAISWAKL
tara:strand:- start:9356 stop:9571 length:216 start_codon:yes stop_codon:yes gene_type:complete